MLRSGASRSLLRTLNTTSHPAFTAPTAPLRQQLRSQLCTLSRRPHAGAIAKPLAPKTLVWVRGASSDGRPTVHEKDKKREEEIQAKKLPVTPEAVSTTSTIMPTTGTPGDEQAPQEAEPEMMAGIKSDLQTIRETFSLEEVPQQAYYMGLAGVLPYMATSLSTVYCAFEINQAHDTGSGLFLTANNAEQLLHIIEPIQVGYGAVILSFLGAIHWGLEWAQFGGTQGYPRYAIGVLSTAVAWPTIFMPVEYALITQFLAFTFLYYTDVRAKTRGWAPPWYGIYRFVLTFIVGSSIVVSLIGRGQVADRIGRKQSTADKIRAFGEYHPDEQEEMEEGELRRQMLGDEGEDEDEEEEEEEGEGEGEGEGEDESEGKEAEGGDDE